VKIINLNSEINIHIIQYNSKEYKQAVQLRENILRKPLGLKTTTKDIKNDCNEIIFGVFFNNSIIGVTHLVPLIDCHFKLRQMALAEKFQGKGIGKKLLKYVLKYAKEKKLKTIFLHARENAIPFYEKSGFQCYGISFKEVGIAHKKMKITIS